jgi:hypothetical protein
MHNYAPPSVMGISLDRGRVHLRNLRLGYGRTAKWRWFKRARLAIEIEETYRDISLIAHVLGED